MNGLMGTLKGRFAGIPVWMIVAALVGVGYWWVKKRGSGTQQAQDSTSADSANAAGVFDTGPLAQPMPTQDVFYINVPGQPNPGVTTGPGAGGAPGGSTQPPGGGSAPGGHPGTPNPPPKTTSISYTVQRGDTLSAIASKYKVKGGWKGLYQADKSIIDATARAHGYTGDKPQDFIYPGERLAIPA